MTLISYGVLPTPSATRHRMINRALAETTHVLKQSDTSADPPVE